MKPLTFRVPLDKKHCRAHTHTHTHTRGWKQTNKKKSLAPVNRSGYYYYFLHIFVCLYFSYRVKQVGLHDSEWGGDGGEKKAHNAGRVRLIPWILHAPYLERGGGAGSLNIMQGVFLMLIPRLTHAHNIRERKKREKTRHSHCRPWDDQGKEGVRRFDSRTEGAAYSLWHWVVENNG